LGQEVGDAHLALGLDPGERDSGAEKPLHLVAKPTDRAGLSTSREQA